MRQFVLPGRWDGGPACELEGRDARRLLSVLRLSPGDSFPAIGPDGAPYSCRIESAGRGRLTLSVAPDPGSLASAGYRPDVRAGRPAPAAAVTGGPPPAGTAAAAPRLILAVGLLKGSKLDDVVRIAAEAGVEAVVPLCTARSLPRDHADGRVERLRRVAAEAIGQSGSRVATRVESPATVAELCAARPAGAGGRLGLFFHEAPLAQSSIHRYCTDVPDEIVACVGPEGGFDDAEVGALSDGGYEAAWLGPTVLRAETAAIFAVASLRIVCLERSSWSTTESRE
ncbi:MAG TPA: RsmE family RNA methyltransferase [Spirochaetia bacterium]|nr:16S rRNA (uracil(1498)-N(3))-methyltransferase [Spirochaetaceae bacterium]HPE88605.1 RsmE family RNA methyltransferase [Spirochaetales bacterium]HRW23637.1 RsmE family RNA methyltransferase [Spirochaetia bacterium]